MPVQHEIENFFGVYLLYSTNPKYKGWTYIGFTVDPNRRINQHNKGRHAGGACRTSGRGPWDMTLIVHGFPNKISALRFEWAWQNPDTSRRLKDKVPVKKKKMTAYQHKIQIMCTMLRTGPWNRLPLTIRWLKQEYKITFEPSLLPPNHMPIAYGPVKSVKLQKKRKSKTSNGNTDEELIDVYSQSKIRTRCSVCVKRIESGDREILKCMDSKCNMNSHLLCLAKKFLESSNQLIPVQGCCPKCKQVLIWGDLIRKKMGCKDDLYTNNAPAEEDEEDDWTNVLTNS